MGAAKPKAALFEEAASLKNAKKVLEELPRRMRAYEVKCLSEYGVLQICWPRVLEWKTL